MQKYKPKNKAGFIIKNERTGEFLKPEKVGVIKTLLRKGGGYDFYEGKGGASVFTREKAQRVIRTLRGNGLDVSMKPAGKKSLNQDNI